MAPWTTTPLSPSEGPPVCLSEGEPLILAVPLAVDTRYSNRTGTRIATICQVVGAYYRGRRITIDLKVMALRS